MSFISSKTIANLQFDAADDQDIHNDSINDDLEDDGDNILVVSDKDAESEIEDRESDDYDLNEDDTKDNGQIIYENINFFSNKSDGRMNMKGEETLSSYPMHINRHREQLELSKDSPFRDDVEQHKSNLVERRGKRQVLSQLARIQRKRVSESTRMLTTNKINENAKLSRIDGSLALQEKILKNKASRSSNRGKKDIERQFTFIGSKISNLSSQVKDIEAPKSSLFKELPIKDVSFQQNIARKPPIDNYKRNVSDNDAYIRNHDHTTKQETRLRPLTGKADCPNCSCDRRTSVCDTCFRLSNQTNTSVKSSFVNPETDSTSIQSKISMYKKKLIDNQHQQEFVQQSLDTKIRNHNQGQESFQISDSIVPISILALNKSLNSRCLKLAKAIEDLTILTKKVEKQSERLEKERKVTLLYKDQWKKYGPQVGGSTKFMRNSSSLCNNSMQSLNYQSRLDPQLQRDMKALNGYNHIESRMKFDNNNHHRSHDKNYWSIKRVGMTQQQDLSRSKSVESIANKKKLNFSDEISTNETIIKTKSTGDLNQTIEESTNVDDKNDASNNWNEDSDKSVEKNKDPMNSEETAISVQQKKGYEQPIWIPMINETKSHDKLTPTRKVKTIFPQTTRSSVAAKTRISKDNLQVNGKSLMKSGNLNSSQKFTLTQKALPTKPLPSNQKITPRQTSNLLKSKAKSSNQNEISQAVGRKINQATSLLSHEYDHSKQIIITPVPMIRRSKILTRLNQNDTEIKRSYARNDSLTRSPTFEIADTLVSNQIKNGAKDPDTESSISQKVEKEDIELIRELKDKLNQSQTRLANILQDERKKHGRLQRRVECSLLKQSDLESENEMLKKSLNKCIDTCLNDIAKTYDALGQMLGGHIIKKLPIVEQQIIDTRSLATNNSNSSHGTSNVTNSLSVMKELNEKIEQVYQQRKSMFDELSKERQKNIELEKALTQARTDLDLLLSSKQSKLNKLLQTMDAPILETSSPSSSSTSTMTTIRQNDRSVNLSKTSNIQDLNKDEYDETSRPEEGNESIESYDLYRQYIDSISPDIEAIKRERKLIISEFENIKSILTEIDTDNTR